MQRNPGLEVSFNCECSSLFNVATQNNAGCIYAPHDNARGKRRLSQMQHEERFAQTFVHRKRTPQNPDVSANQLTMPKSLTTLEVIS
jgi:hypothetical protein